MKKSLQPVNENEEICVKISPPVIFLFFRNFQKKKFIINLMHFHGRNDPKTRFTKKHSLVFECWKEGWHANFWYSSNDLNTGPEYKSSSENRHF